MRAAGIEVLVSLPDPYALATARATRGAAAAVTRVVRHGSVPFQRSSCPELSVARTWDAGAIARPPWATSPGHAEGALPCRAVSDGDEVLYPTDERAPRWYVGALLSVRWDARRDHQLAVVGAVGTFMVERFELGEDDDQGKRGRVRRETGTIRIAKPVLGEADAAKMLMTTTSPDELVTK